MATRRVNNQNDKQSRRPPGRTPEERENQLIALAYDLAEKKLNEGTASSQEVTFFLKLGSKTEKLAQQFKEEEIKLLKIKAETIASQQRSEELMTQALAAFRAYSGNGPLSGEDDDED